MMTSADLSGKFALDVQAVNELRTDVKRTDKAGLEAAAKQFEVLFMNMMLKSMREATSQDSLMDSDQSRLYTSMLDQQLSQSMASRGIGLADMMVRQLGRGLPVDLPGEGTAPASAHSGTGVPETSPQENIPVQQQPLQQTQPPPQQQSSALTPQPSQLPQAPQQAALQPGSQSQVAEFQSRLMPHAVQASQTTGIPARFMLGQAALESGWGKREIRAADGTPSHNLFGVKAGSNWKGSVVETVTTEYVNGVAQKSVEKFRAYSSYADAFRDYANLLRNNPRYADVVAQATQGIDAAGFAQGLQRAGYATDPNYADKLTRIIKTTQWS
ncbi:flagellar protein FlgJ [Nitrosospira sp. Nsp5]|uniref:Peptidoglycan hydrolase FlgJ n=1 Tax=Nitrosospira multiformis TaxID=1231 RepID=A0ABY0TE39_9PROT|nr:MULTISPECIES: flagellar assembly peptidoglycan hydrolase FlgJ [Nitrosospira]PTR09020.1 flagellar protein FlgJ [Nitrosospira sp. Nsp5]SDQ69162.1 flagellar protein FlgJ [Nitrosospira multiformis]